MLGFAAPRLALIELKNGLRFYVRTRMDIWVLKETTLDRQYERASVAILDGWSIVDIGAGLGDFAVSVAKTHPRCAVYAYEPFPESFHLLNENLHLNQTNNVEAFPCAVGAASGSLQLHAVSAEAVQQTTIAGTSTLESNAIQVKSISLDQVFLELGLARCDYLKMDCEGAEYSILFNASPATLRKIKHICLEYHDDVTPYTHNNLGVFLEKNGFRVHLTANPAHWQWGLLHAENQVEW
jgi:FkbM family methyltransferase